MSEPAASRTHDILAAGLGLGALALLAGSGSFVDTSGPDPFYKGPLIFPIITLVLVVLGALPSFWRLVRPPVGTRWYLDGHGWPKAGLGVLPLLFVYPYGIIWIGLEAASFLFIASALILVGERRPARVFPIALAASAGVYVVFKLMLDIWFPAPLLLEGF